MRKKGYLKKFLLLAIIGVVLIVFFLYTTQTISKLTGKAISTDSETDQLAKCLTEKGVKLYGAYWCPHCNNQKELFGSSLQYISYVECAEGTANSNPQACQDAGISGYPTWIINNRQYPGEQSLIKLKQLSGC